MTIKDVERVYLELKGDIVRLSKKELAQMYSTLYTTPLKSYHRKYYIADGISRYFESIKRAKMLKP